MDDEIKGEMLVWRPVLAKVISLEEVSTPGVVTLARLLKINALLDMKSDVEYHMTKSKDGGR